MKNTNINPSNDSIADILLSASAKWQPPYINDVNDVPKGDMPGDKIQINQEHIRKANVIFPKLLRKLAAMKNNSGSFKAVVSVYGGSGVGKSEIGSLISHYLNLMNVGSYVMSGDNYPHRIPKYNDTERTRIFRTWGIKGIINANLYNENVKKQLMLLWDKELDADKNQEFDYPWLSVYQETGQNGLAEYLGSPGETNFEEVNQIINDFKEGKEQIMLKRMGREPNELWYDPVDFSQINVLVIEWSQGSNTNLKGIDIPILLNSTPEETLEHRRLRNRDGKVDSPFTSLVLAIEQDKLKKQAGKAEIIITKNGDLIDYNEFLSIMGEEPTGNGPMLNAYPDSLGNNLKDSLTLLKKPEMSNCFESFYILPSIFNTDLDRGFSVIDYSINDTLASEEDIDELRDLNIDLKLDFILNHASVLSKQFQDILANGQASKYADFFINWNKFWGGYGELNDKGIIVPDDIYIKDMFFRKPGLPILSIRMPDGKEIPYWNTFYQEVKYDTIDAQDIIDETDIQYEKAKRIADIANEALEKGIKPADIDFNGFDSYREKTIDMLEAKRKYLGQMDLNINSPLVWDFYDGTLKKLSSYGAKIVRLDAFAYAPKSPGKRNFLNVPDTWDFLSKIKLLAEKYHLQLLPEIHSKYEEKTHIQLAEQGFMTYDFFLPGLLLDAIERKTTSVLKHWIKEIIDNRIRTVNMLGCHDGIPLLDLKGLLDDKQIQGLIDIVVSRGGYIKDLHGKKNIYYQVNAAYYSALGEDDKRLLFARAVQMFMPGKPQIWYLDLFAGKNDYDAVERAGAGGHKEINRSNLTLEDITSALNEEVVIKQLDLIRQRNTHPAFKEGAEIFIKESDDNILIIVWENNNQSISLEADFKDCTYTISSS